MYDVAKIEENLAMYVTQEKWAVLEAVVKVKVVQVTEVRPVNLLLMEGVVDVRRSMRVCSSQHVYA